MLNRYTPLLVFGWVREVSEWLHASGVYSSRERINRNEQA